MQTIAISIDEPTLLALDRVRTMRARSKTSRSEFIRRAVQRYLADLERAEHEAREVAIVEKHHKKLNAQALAAIEEQAKP